MLEKIRKLIEEYFEMEHGEYIKDHLSEITFTNSKITIKMTFKALKHIVEKRKNDVLARR